MHKDDAVEGNVHSIVYANEENGYTVLRIQAEPTRLVVAVGVVPHIVVGEYIQARGAYTTHANFGQQFKIESYTKQLPAEEDQIVAYLGSGVIKGIGHATALRIVQKFGRETLDILQNNPKALADIKGINEAKAVKIGKDFLEINSVNVLVDFLIEYQIPVEVAAKLYKFYGIHAINVIKTNPYILSGQDCGLDFMMVDRMAIGMGFDADSDERCQAAVTFELTYNSGEMGHTFIPTDKLVAACTQLICVDQGSIIRAIENLTRLSIVKCVSLAGVQVCYMSEVYNAEHNAAVSVCERLKSKPVVTEEIEQHINEYEEVSNIQLAQMQRQAIKSAIENNILVLTGGPGTGKSTTVRGILFVLKRLQVKTALAATTGKAAKRLSQLCGAEARTLHRLLEAEFALGTTVFNKNGDNLLECGAVVVDEASMIDIHLFNGLMQAMKENCRLIIVGDCDQLPSVGCGNVLSDLINTQIIPVVYLNQIFRQAVHSDIIYNAHKINNGEMPNLDNKTQDFFFMRRGSEAGLDTIVELCKTRLPKKLGINPNDIEIITPSRRYGMSTDAINKALQQALNPPADDKEEKTFGFNVFRVGDKVMQTSNNYHLVWKSIAGDESGIGVFNGDVGIIHLIDNKNQVVLCDFDDQRYVYPFDALEELSLAYAVTVHKAQGSEFDVVIFAAFDTPERLLRRNVLYTAVTRAKKMLIIVGRSDIIAYMVENNKQQKRYTGLKYMIVSGMENGMVS